DGPAGHAQPANSSAPARTSVQASELRSRLHLHLDQAIQNAEERQQQQQQQQQSNAGSQQQQQPPQQQQQQQPSPPPQPQSQQQQQLPTAPSPSAPSSAHAASPGQQPAGTTLPTTPILQSFSPAAGGTSVTNYIVCPTGAMGLPMEMLLNRGQFMLPPMGLTQPLMGQPMMYLQLPPGVQLQGGVQLPAGVQLPP
ncbi:hypothetical protein Agub_g3321, partial [Astrephomene gubernaculifera]